MPYVSFSLKYRPRRFDDVIGQQHVARTLKNAIANNRVGHAYLFTGPRGTGKTSTARIFAAALNCENGPTPEPCGTCSMCNAVIAGNAMDVIEMDAASNRGIDDIRDLREKVKFAPAEGRYKIYILDEAHQLTDAANNALLKTLEEPPAHVVFMLLTTEAHKIIPTIMSRCQHFDFRAITMADIVTGLRRIATEEGISTDDTALMAIADAADGAMRDAQSIFDQIVAYAGQTVTVEVVNEVLGVTDRGLLSGLTDFVVAGDVAGCFDLVEQAIADGRDLVRMVEDLTLYMRDLLRLELAADPEHGLRTSAQATEQMRAQANTLGADRLLDAINTLAGLRSQLSKSSQQVLLVEVALAQLCRPATATKRAPSHKAEKPAPVPQPQRQERPEPPPAPPAPPVDESGPQPAPQPPAQPPAQSEPPAPRPQPVVLPEGGLDFATVCDNWERVHEELRRADHMSVSGMLRGAQIVDFSDGRVVLGFSAEFPHGRFESIYKELVEDALGCTFGTPVHLECRLFGSQQELDASCRPREAGDDAQLEPTSADPTEAKEPAVAPEPDASAPSQTTHAEEPAPTASAPATDTPPEPVPTTVAAEPEPTPAPLQPPDTEPVAAPEPEEPLSQEQAVAQTLRLFEGSSEMSDDGDEDEETS